MGRFRGMLMTVATVALGAALGALVSRSAVSWERPAARASTDVSQRQDVRVARTRRHARTSAVRDAVESDAAEATDVAEELPPPPEPLPKWEGLPLVLRLVDGETGAPLSSGSAAAAEGRTMWRKPREDTRIALLREGGLHRLSAAPGGPGQTFDIAFDVEPPSGYIVATDEDVARSHVDVSPFARSLAVTVPLRRAIDVRLDVRATSGHRIARRLTGVAVYVGAGLFRTPLKPPHRVSVPFLRGEELVARARTSSSWEEVVVRLLEYAPRLDLSIRIPPTRAPAGEYRGPCGSVTGCRLPGDYDPGEATLDLIVTLRDGRPAHGASAHATLGRRTEFARVDQTGLARFARLPAGQWAIEVNEDGMVRTTGAVELGEREHRVLRLLEPRGETAEITVLNHRGERLPFARVEVENCGLARGGVQLLDHFTGTDGVCRVERMSDEQGDVRAHWAGRTAVATWRPGDALTLTIPKPKR